MTEQPRQSSLVKVATFVASKGEGGKFTKLEMLEAVPGVAQADRRMRDLRSMGWVIDNYKINPNLSPDQYLVRTIGTRVDQGEKPVAQRKTITGAKRRRIFQRDGYVCQSCFTAAWRGICGRPGPEGHAHHRPHRAVQARRNGRRRQPAHRMPALQR